MVGLGAPVEVVGEGFAGGVLQFELEKVHGGEGGGKVDWAEAHGGGRGYGDVVAVLVGDGAVEVVGGEAGGGVGEGVGEVVDDLEGAVGLVVLDVDELGGGFDGEEGGVGFEVVVVELPDEAGLGGVAHPGDDAGGGVEELGVAALVHGAEGLVVGELGLADEVGEVGDGAVAAGDDAGVFVAFGGSLGEVVLGPGVGDGVPVFAGGHAGGGFEGGDGHAAGVGFEDVVGDGVELARGAPVVRAVRADAA